MCAPSTPSLAEGEYTRTPAVVAFERDGTTRRGGSPRAGLDDLMVLPASVVRALALCYCLVVMTEEHAHPASAANTGDSGPDGTDVPRVELRHDARRISRREALRRVAVAGAAAGAVWAAPRIEGMSIAPDYAAAASGNNANKTTPALASSASRGYNCFCFGFGNACCVVCWSGTNGSNCSGAVCGNCTNNCTGTQNTQLIVPTFNNPNAITMNGALSGNVRDANAALNLVLNGIDPPFQQCTVAVNGVCNSGSFTLNPPSGYAGPYNTSPGTIGPFSPQCSGSDCSNLNASLTINLQCNFNN